MPPRPLGQCHAECPFCARAFWAWFKARIASMSRTRPGDGQSFAQAAATSIKPADPLGR